MSSDCQNSAPLNDVIAIAVSQLIDDAQVDRRDPSHSDLDFEIKKAKLSRFDPKSQGQTVGKAKRLRTVLSAAIEQEQFSGERLVFAIIATVRGHGGFRETSPNFVGHNAIENAKAAFDSEGYELTSEGQVRPKLLENLSSAQLTAALEAYVRRAKNGSEDAALLAGTGKDLLEATAAHVIMRKFGSYPAHSNFPTLLGQAFLALGLATPQSPVISGELAQKKIDRALYDLACGVNALRNKEGTGHGRPWTASVTAFEAKTAIESMGLIAERLLYLLDADAS